MSTLLSKRESDHSAYEEELRRRAWETLPRIHKLILFISERFKGVPFEGSQLYNEFLKNCSARRKVLRQSMEELKKKGYVVQFKRISYRKRLWIATAELFERAIKIGERLKEHVYLSEVPSGALELRGHLRPLGRKSASGVHLNVFSKALSDAANRHEIPCKIYRFKDTFVVRAGNGSIKAHGRKWSIDLSLQKRLIYDHEMELLKNKKIIPVSVFVLPDDWRLKKWEMFTESKEAQILVKELSKYLEIRVLPSHNYNVNKWRFDIEIEDFVVEVTTHKPWHRGGPHSSQASVVRSKVLDALLYSLETNRHSIAVLSSAWAKKKYMHDLDVMTKKHGCHIIFVDFDNVDWPRKAVDRILKITQNS